MVELVDQALAALEDGRAGDGVALAIEAWRACRLPALADAIEAMAPPWPALMLPGEEYTRRWQPVRSARARDRARPTTRAC